MTDPAKTPVRFNQEADAALEEFYSYHEAFDNAAKIVALESEMGAAHYYAFGGFVDDEMKLGCLEYEFLSLKGLIELSYV